MITKFVDDICSISRALGIFILIFIKISLIDLMKSSYGNYVMQKALKVSKGDNKLRLTESIINNIDKLNDKKLFFKWKQIASEASGKNLNFPCMEILGNYSQNVSPNTSFNSNQSNNSRNSNNNNLNSNNPTFSKKNQTNVNSNVIFNNAIHNNINNFNINKNNFTVNPMCNINNGQNIHINTGMNYYYMPKNFSRSYNNSPVNMRMEQMFPNYNNFNNQGKF